MSDKRVDVHHDQPRVLVSAALLAQVTPDRAVSPRVDLAWTDSDAAELLRRIV